MFECYHPSAQNTEPCISCNYLGTPGLDDDEKGETTISFNSRLEKIKENRRLGDLYSRFKPRRAHPAGDVPGSRTSHNDQGSRNSKDAERVNLVTQSLSLDAHELFSQLSVTAALVRLGPRWGIFLSLTDIVEKKTLRVWRDWLARRSEAYEISGRPSTAGKLGIIDDGSDSILWASPSKTLGLKVRVKEQKWRRDHPILVHKDEDQAS
ncbi:MAG: hypothetical protein LQ342_003054 [Letrouitia transgressa]|nr:MAG: hypothetical protein LQ342_003054 [Letrouitia transgressa]